MLRSLSENNGRSGRAYMRAYPTESLEVSDFELIDIVFKLSDENIQGVCIEPTAKGFVLRFPSKIRGAIQELFCREQQAG
ncbi:hypothetical protein JXD20_03050 [Candidatus Peregrinibacteria bacterium]|nr:hypothetical protein [Candidatus Peregrinibacteria bacterium]